MLNTVGPFSKWGPEVVQACLAAGAHYTDTTGEQDWLITCDEQYGADFAAAGLLLAPGIAQMYTTGEIAAEVALEKPGLDTLDIAVFWGGSPTIASTQTILFNAALSNAHYLEQNSYVAFDPEGGHTQLVIPGQHELGLALPWGGTSHPVWYRRDPRVANVKALGGVFNRALMLGVPQIVAAAIEATKDMEADEKYAALAATAAQVMSSMPPRENPRLNKSLDSVHASGPLGRAHCVIHGNQNYKQTGLLQAYAAYSLLQQPPEAGRVRLGLPGVRAPRAARRAALVRPGLRAGADGRGLGVRLADYLDKGASLRPDAPCLTTDGATSSYAEVQALSVRVAAALEAQGVSPGDTVAILSANDPVAFTTVFGISRAGAVWCPINPRNEASENRELLELFECRALVFQASFAPLVEQIRHDLPALTTLVCLDGQVDGALTWTAFLEGGGSPAPAEPVDDVAMIVGTGGTTGRPKGVLLTNRNLETMTAITLMSYPFEGRPVYLALAPLTHAAGVLCFPVLALGGEVVVMRAPDVGGFLEHVERHRVTHTFLPPTLIYMALAHERLDATDLTSLQCFWYGAAPMSAARLEEALTRIGPVMAQLFGQTEAPMMISTLAPRDHFRPDGSVAHERLSSAGRPAPLVTVSIMADDGSLLPTGETGEIVVRGSLVMAGYHRDPEATATASAHGWHHTGDIGYLDPDGYLFIVDRAKDMVITGGFNVYSTEVEQALMAHPDVQDCAVVGLPDDKWGERVVAVVQPRVGSTPDPAEVAAFVKARIGSVKAPKQVELWSDLPRSKVGKVLKTDIKARLAH